MECTTHKGEKVFMVCKSCDKCPFVCGVCLEEEHAEHKVQTLRNAAQSLRQNLEQADTDNEQVFKDIRSDLDGITKFREDQQIEADCVEDGIANHIDVITREVDSVKHDVMEKYKGESVKNKEAIERTEEALKKQVSQIDTFKMKVAQLQKMNDYVDVIKTARDLEVPDTNRLPRPEIQPLEFVPGSVKVGELEKMIGDINIADSSNNNAVTTSEKGSEGNDDKTNTSSDFVGSVERHANIKVTKVSSFKLDDVAYMFCSQAGFCWLKCQGKNSVKISTITGQIIQAVNLGTKTTGFTVTSDNRLLMFCCPGQQCVKQMELSSGEITELFNTRPLTPNEICTSSCGEIYVTTYDKHDYNIQKKSKRVLIRCTLERKLLCSESIFGIPGKVSVNISGSRLAVINHISASRSELFILNKDLCPITIYRGPSVLPWRYSMGYVLNGAVFDAMDNVLVIEGCSKTVHFLSPSCELLKVLLTMDAHPWTLSLNGDEIWVGDNEKNIHVLRYSY